MNGSVPAMWRRDDAVGWRAEVRLSARGVVLAPITIAPAWAENACVSPTVLIVDDHAAFRALARELLQADGYEVVGEATDGQAGLEAVCALRPDVVLLDVRLPDMDGFDLADRLATAGCRSALVVTSSSDDPLYPERATCCGARGFVAKHDVCGAALDRLIAETA